MVTKILTDEKIKAGEAFLRIADASNIKIEAALWFYFQDQEIWKLMLSFKNIEIVGPKSIYNKLQKILSKIKNEHLIFLDEIVLLKPKDPLLALLKTVMRVSSDITGIRFTGNVIGGQLIPDTYIYRLRSTKLKGPE